jgi:hypothetical protein
VETEQSPEERPVGSAHLGVLALGARIMTEGGRGVANFE